MQARAHIDSEEFNRLLELLRKQPWVQGIHPHQDSISSFRVSCKDGRVWLVEQPRHFVWLKYQYGSPEYHIPPGT